MEFEKLSKKELIEEIYRLKNENDYLKHLSNELDNNGFHLNSILYQLMLNNLPFMAWMKDTTGRFIAVNHFFENKFEKDNSEIIGKNEFELFDYDIAKKFTDEDNEVISSKKSNVIYAKTIEKGIEHFHETYKAPVMNSDGSVIATFGFSRDITDQYILRNESALSIKLSEEKYRLLVENAFDSIYIIGESGYEYVNPRFCEITKYSYEELTSSGFDYNKLLSEESTEFMKKRFELRKSGRDLPNKYEISILNKVGSQVDLEVTTTDISKNGIMKILGVMRDITAKKKADRELAESEEKFRLIAENLPGVLYLCNNDLNYSVLYINNAIYSLTGYSKEDFIAGKINFPDFYHQDDYKMIFDTVNNALSENKSFHIIYRMKHKNGKYRWVEETGAGVFIDKNLLYLEGIIFDITNRIELEEELKLLNTELENRVIERTAMLDETLEELKYEMQERNRVSDELIFAKDELAYMLAKEKELNLMKSRFISMISHEYRTPLTVILTSTYLLDRYFVTGDKSRFQDNLKRIQESVQYIIRLLEDVLFIGKGESGKNILKIEEINIISLLQEIFNEIKINNNNGYKFELVNSVPTLKLFTDPLVIRQIFSNLFSNAVKYSEPEKTITMRISDTGEFLLVSVIDEGVGIPENEMEYLFEPFHRFSNVGLREGTGLGLSIVKRAVELIKSEIFVKSEINTGTEFIVKIPKFYEYK